MGKEYKEGDHGKVIFTREDKVDDNENAMLDYYGVESAMAMLYGNSMNVPSSESEAKDTSGTSPDAKSEEKGENAEAKQPIQKLDEKKIESKVDISLLLANEKQNVVPVPVAAPWLSIEERVAALGKE